MPVSTKKTILFARAAEGKVIHQWPVAVFNEPAQAKSYAAMIRLAHKSGSADMVKSLDSAHKLDGGGAPLPDVKFSLVTVPYAPQPQLDDDAVEGDASS